MNRQTDNWQILSVCQYRQIHWQILASLKLNLSSGYKAVDCSRANKNAEWHSGESTRLLPMWSGFESWRRRHTCMLVEFVVGSRPCSGRFSPCISVFPLLKNKHFQIPFRSGTHGHVSTTSWELLNAPWVKKCQVTIFFLPVPNLHPSSSLIVLGHRHRAGIPAWVLEKAGVFTWPPLFFCSLASALKKIFHFML